MNIKEAVEYFGARDYRCSVSTVRKLVKAGRLGCYRPGLSGRGRMEFRATTLEAFLRTAEVGGPAAAEAPPQPKAPPPRAPKPDPDPKPAAPGWRERAAKVARS